MRAAVEALEALTLGRRDDEGNPWDYSVDDKPCSRRAPNCLREAMVERINNLAASRREAEQNEETR